MKQANYQHIYPPKHDHNVLESDLNPQIKQWILRILVPLGGLNTLVGYHGFENEKLACRMGLMAYDVHDRKSFDHMDFDAKVEKNNLRKLYAAQADKQYSLPCTLQNNILALSKLTQLSSTDCRLLEFVALLQTDTALNEACELLGRDINDNKMYSLLSLILHIPVSDIKASLSYNSALQRAGLLTVDYHTDNYLQRRLEILSYRFAETLCSGNVNIEELLRGKAHRSPPSKLTLANYPRLTDQIAVLLPYLRHCLEQKKHGVNILLYGVPGTGKTELIRLIAELTDCELCEIDNEDESNKPNSWRERLNAYRAAQYFFATQKKLILFDEVEDIFNNGDRYSGAGQYKAWMNHLLENNAIPTFWVSNHVEAMDSAFVRRFDMIIEVPLPDRAQREKIIRQHCMNLLDHAAIKRMTNAEQLSPAMIERSAKVISSIMPQLNNAEEAMEMLLNNTLTVQGAQNIERSQKGKVPSVYDPAFIHADADMAAIAEGLLKHPIGRLCLYGPPGTGKTAYGHWLAEKLDKPLIIKRTSDLLSMWAGGTEKNMAAAFSQAEQEQAILMIDEVDSFLQDRRTAQRSWEVSQVNEMLTQMESFDGIFIASTNLMDGIDQAALRRFDLKAKFDFLQTEQAWQLFCRYCDTLQLNAQQGDARQRLRHITNLTPGDFAAVIRQHRFNPIKSSDDFLHALLTEVAIKQPTNKTIGFVKH